MARYTFPLFFLLVASKIYATGRAEILDFYQLADPRLVETARSVAVKVHRSHLKPLNDGTVLIERVVPELRMCLLSDFYEQLRIPPLVAGGFLYSGDLLMTAGHAVRSEEDCSSFAWVFDYAVKEPTQTGGGGFIVDESAVYNCAQIIKSRVLGCGGDVAVVRLDREVVDRRALEVRTTGTLVDGAKLVMMGYPNGLPLKSIFVENTFNKRDADFYISHSVGGFSGSPVIDADTGLVEGVAACVFNNHRSGATKETKGMLYDEQNACFRFIKDDESPRAGEGIVGRMENILRVYSKAPFFPQSLPPVPPF